MPRAREQQSGYHVVTCPHCGEEREVALPRANGLSVRCGTCRKVFCVSADGEVASETE